MNANQLVLATMMYIHVPQQLYQAWPRMKGEIK